MVFLCIASIVWSSIALHGIALHRIAWHCIAFDYLLWYCMVLHRLHGVVQLIWRAGELPRSASSHFSSVKNVRFVRVPPYESGVKLTNFTFSWQNGELLWGQKCSPNFLNQNEELSKKLARVCVYTSTYTQIRDRGSDFNPCWMVNVILLLNPSCVTLI